MNGHTLRLLALTLATVWALVWTFFATAESTTEGKWIPALLAAALFLGSLLIAWRWSLAGGIILLIEGLAVFLAYPLGFLQARRVATQVFVTTTVGLPPLLSGTLLIFSHLASRHHSAT